MEARVRQWLDVTRAALVHVYVGEEEAKSFEGVAKYVNFSVYETWESRLETYRNAAEDGISKLDAMKSALRFAEAPSVAGAASDVSELETAPTARTIFLVHGHDNRREEVARFLERACQHRYKVVILDEQPGRSRTLIERLERHSLDAEYAVILFTGDDVGAAKTTGIGPEPLKHALVRTWFSSSAGSAVKSGATTSRCCTNQMLNSRPISAV